MRCLNSKGTFFIEALEINCLLRLTHLNLRPGWYWCFVSLRAPKTIKGTFTTVLPVIEQVLNIIRSEMHSEMAQDRVNKTCQFQHIYLYKLQERGSDKKL